MPEAATAPLDTVCATKNPGYNNFPGKKVAQFEYDFYCLFLISLTEFGFLSFKTSL